MTPPDDDRHLYVGTWNESDEPVADGTYRGTPLWRRLVALFGLSAFAVLGGIIIFLAIAALIALGAVVLQLVIS